MSEQEEQKPKQKIADNLIFVGKKPFMNYINSSQYILREHDTIEICARGKSISKAVDIAEVLTERFMKNQIEKVSITTSSEAFDSKEGNGKKISVSAIKIVLKKKQKAI